MIKDGKLEILMHALDTQFAEKYKAQIRTYKTFEELKQFLQSVFRSTLTDEEKLNNARRLMENATRHAKDNEPFEVFHKRLQNIGLEITQINGSRDKNLYQRCFSSKPLAKTQKLSA